ncbi:hypothetical protein B8W69_09235 [Mycobacterium vulneris]|uniref:Uncharacterized protein n=1 Tax=Mycolicibacterium vulneris TaxID=547163 RepID=A0A1X2L5J3_9MYCO|nr:hypothetical protein [Mycolicibacterium vulneris]OSC29185.1 hypothetical protein B8W69_09235 [Mycolicibacterium vulneris]
MRSRRWSQIRRIREWLALSASIALIPWIVYLGLTLPQSYTAQHWQATWVGFDLLLLAFMLATATLGFARHRLLPLFAFATGVLLLCDAWFDMLTARRGDFALSVLTAVLGELPLATVADRRQRTHCALAGGRPIRSSMAGFPTAPSTPADPN